jgi:hypothetical protein
VSDEEWYRAKCDQVGWYVDEDRLEKFIERVAIKIEIGEDEESVRRQVFYGVIYDS